MTPRDARAKFAGRLRLVADLRGHSTAGALAKAMKMDRQPVYLWWNGEGYPRPETAAALAQALDCAPGWLLFGDTPARIASDAELFRALNPDPEPA